MYASLIYNVNVATSVTTQGRGSVSTMTLFFEAFLANNVKFGSLNEVLTYIDNIIGEKRKYNDTEWLDRNRSVEECFATLVMTCGYRWAPEQDDLDIIWQSLINLQQEDINRIYYKNNLYEFIGNSKIQDIIKKVLMELKTPYINPLKCPNEIREDMDILTDLMREYVYYGYMTIDRIDRCDNMIKSVTMISDTDSTIISLDAWFQYVNNLIIGLPLQIARFNPEDILITFERDEFGDIIDRSKLSPVKFVDNDYDYDFEQDKVIELKKMINPIKIYPEDNVRFSIVNMMSYVLDALVNEHMEKMVKNQHGENPTVPCKILAKNEFFKGL